MAGFAEKSEITVIGGGIIGLAVASSLSEKYKEIILLEKLDRPGQETSSRNSEVIHGGMYYPAGSLKAKMCVEGRRLLYQLCSKHDIPHKKIGKLIVACEEEEAGALNKLLLTGNENGVEGLKLLSNRELKNLEPNVKAKQALYSPETGIVDSHQLMTFFIENAKKNGVIIALNSEVTGIEKIQDGYRIRVKNNGEILDLETRILINCAGLDSDTIAALAGIDIEKAGYKLHYCKGRYFRVNDAKSNRINRLVYPVPKPKSGGLGIHATLDLRGGMRLGPDDEYLNNRIKDYSVDSSKKNDFFVSAKKFMSFLEKNDLYPDTSGIRPKLQDKNGGFRDFIIREESDKGSPGFINLIGIESPGLTACYAIGGYVQAIVQRL